MEPNMDENIDPNTLIVQRIIINNFEIKSNNFVNSPKMDPNNDITMVKHFEEFSNNEEKYPSKSTTLKTDLSSKFLFDDELHQSDILQDCKCFICCSICKNVIALEGSTYSKLK